MDSEGKWECPTGLPRLLLMAGILLMKQPMRTIQLFMGNYTESQWVTLGTWEIPEIYKDTAQLSLVLQAVGGQAGEIPVDAAAFVKIE